MKPLPPAALRDLKKYDFVVVARKKTKKGKPEQFRVAHSGYSRDDALDVMDALISVVGDVQHRLGK